MNRARRLLLILALPIIAVRANGDDSGTICIAARDLPFDANAECFATTTIARIPVRPAKERRRFVWTSPARQDLVLGVILPGDRDVAFADTRRGVMQLDLTGSPHRDWPAKSTVQLTERDLGRWTFTLDEKQVVNAVTLHLPRGVYDLIVSAAGHRVMKHDGLKIATANAQPVRMKIALAPAMRIIATVASAGEPVAWARVMADCDRPLCESAVDGRVRCDVPDPPLRMLCIEQPRFGRRRILVDSSRLDVDLGRVELTRSSTLLVERPPHIALPAGTTATLYRTRPNSRPAEIAKRSLDDDHSIAIFDDLDAGDYKVLLQGPEPLQRAVMDVSILAESEKTLPIAFDAYKLVAKVLFDDKPFPNAGVELMESLWKSRVKTDEDGRFEAQLWSPVELGMLISGGSLREPFGTMMRAAMNDNEWTIEVPNRKISGHVVDASTRKAVPRAKLRVESDDGNVRFSRIALADDDGHYEISAVPPANFQINVQAADYLPAEPADLKMTRDERERKIDFALVRGKRLTLVVRDLNGVPLRDALLAEASPFDPARIVRLLRTGDDGIASTITAEKSVNLIYTMPREGSLAVTPVLATRDGKPVEIRIPPAAGTLRVHAERASGEPLGGLAVTMRMNGQMLPVSVVREFAMLNGGNTVTMPDGEIALPKLPAAMYDLCLDSSSRCSNPGATWVNVALSGDTRVTMRVE